MRMVRILLAYCASLLALLAALDSPLRAQGQKYNGQIIRNIQFSPKQQPLEASELHEILSVKMNEPFRMADVRAAIERLYATGQYADIQVDAQRYRDGVALEFITTNTWFIGAVSVTGEIKTPPNPGQLENASDLGLGQPYTDEKVEEGMGEMKRLLANNGLFMSDLRPVFDWETNSDTQQVNIRFEVDSGDRAKFAKPVLTGNLKMDPERVEDSMHLKRFLIHTWKPMTQSRVRRAVDGVRSLYQKEDRLEAKVMLDGVRYHPENNSASPALRIDAGPVIEFRIIGADLSRGNLKRLVPVFEEQTVDFDLLAEGARNLRDYYQTKGYFDAEVEFKQQAVINDKATIDYLVNPGERHKFVHLEITGNRYFQTSAIRERMFLQTVRFLQYRRGRYSGNLLRRDEDAIRNLYRSNGFRDVQVITRTQDDYRGKSGDLAVFIDILEGPQYFVHDLQVEGIEKLDRNQIMAKLSSAPGQPFSEFNVAVDRDAILGEYLRNGFPDATFEWDVKPAAEPNQMDVRFVIREGRQQFVRAVLISGYHVTRPSLINRQISLNPGDPLSPIEMNEIQRRLYGLGVFARVNAAIQNPEGETTRKYVLYNVEEARRYSIAVGLGAEMGRIGGSRTSYTAPGGAAGFAPRVSFDITRTNLWGLAHSLSLRTRVSTLNQRGVLTYAWPRFSNHENLTASLSGLYERSLDIRTFAFQRFQVSTQLMHRLDKARTLFYRFTFRRSNVSNLLISPFLISQQEPVRAVLPSIGYIEDRRDDPLDAHRGIFNTLDFGVADRIFGSEINFTRFLGRNATYHPLTRRLTLARSTEFGHIFGFNNPDLQEIGQIPLPERFYGGGATSHRGFPEFQAGPRDLSTGFPIGGTALLFNQTELRFPFIGDNIGGVLFHDAGNIYSKLGNFSFRVHQKDIQDFDYMVHAVGFGVRYRTPVGPVRVDLAYSINPPTFFGVRADATSTDIVNAGPNPCFGPSAAGLCEVRNLGHFRWFISIGQTF